MGSGVVALIIGSPLNAIQAGKQTNLKLTRVGGARNHCYRLRPADGGVVGERTAVLGVGSRPR